MFPEKLKIAKAIILTSNSLRLQGVLLYSFDIVYLNEEDEIINRISFNNTTKRFQIDISKGSVEKYSIKELTFIILHEMLHAILNHISRSKNLVYEIFNLAADHVINLALKNDIRRGIIKGVSVPNDCFIIDDISNLNYSMEEVYNYLLEKAKFKKSKISKNVDVSLIELELNNKKYKIIQDITFDINAKKEEENLKNKIKRTLNSNIITKGNEKSNVFELIKNTIIINLPWDELLVNIIKKYTREITNNRSWKNLNKRLRSYNLTLPGLKYEESLGDLFLVIDTSGSISNVDLDKFVSIIKSSLNYFNRIIKIDHDFNIQEITTIEINDDVLIKFKGRGGTSHTEVYDFIESIYNGSNLDYNPPNLILFLTDFESNIDTIHNNYNWHKEIPYKFILTKNKKISKDIDSNPIII